MTWPDFVDPLPEMRQSHVAAAVPFEGWHGQDVPGVNIRRVAVPYRRGTSD